MSLNAAANGALDDVYLIGLARGFGRQLVTGRIRLIDVAGMIAHVAGDPELNLRGIKKANPKFPY